MTSTNDVDANLEAARELVDTAAQQGATLIALPENFAFMRREGSAFPCAQGFDGEIVGCLRSLARKHGVWLLGGSFPEAIAGDSRVYNTSVLLAPSGDLVAHYRKLHLFDVDLSANGGGSFRESESIARGEDVVVASTPFGPLGLSICYDLRFPELYRRMADHGVVWIAVPSAFTPQTGKDHWEVLLRARAIENQCFVVAPAQYGQHGPDRASYGRSLIIDPWGSVLARAPDRPSVIVTDCEVADVERVRRMLPALRHRRF